MRQKKKTRWWYVAIGGILFVFFLILGTCTAGVLSPIPYLHLDPFRGKVIDADTKQPISGAAVLAVYYKSTASVAGSNSWIVDGQETLTDEYGEFKIPEARRWFVSHRGYTEGNLIIFIPAYGSFPKNQRSKAVGENKSWPPPDRYVMYELPKLETKEERKDNVIYTRRYNEIAYSKRTNYWKTINEERINLGLPPNTMTEMERKR